MNLQIRQRRPEEVPAGALLMAPLCLLPLCAWLVEHGWIEFGECGLKMLLGLPCFTCGATRATVALTDGDIAGAIGFQPLIVLIYAVLTIWGLVSFGTFLADRRVVISLSNLEKTALKASILAAPFVNWAYLIAAGI